MTCSLPAAIIITAVMMLQQPARHVAVFITIPSRRSSRWVSCAFQVVSPVFNTVIAWSRVGRRAGHDRRPPPIVVDDGYPTTLARGLFALEPGRRGERPGVLPRCCWPPVRICMIFLPDPLHDDGMFRDFLTFFLWTITINLMYPPPLAVLVIPFLER